MKFMFTGLEKKINVIQEYKGELIKFDPDSSPMAWNHYEEIYNTENEYNLHNRQFMEYISGEYYDIPLSGFNRLMVLPKDTMESRVDDKETKVFLATQRLAGDTDFNFNEKKYKFFSEILYCQSSDYDSFVKYRNVLMNCVNMHHTLLNFSVMPVMGDLQGFKSKGLKKHRKHEYLDRIDTLIYYLSVFFDERNNKNKKENPLKQHICDKKENGQELEKYLERFENVHQYCEKVYFITNRNFVDKMIASGSKLIKSLEDVCNYLQLATEFWIEKKHGLLKDTFAVIGEMFINGGEMYSYEDISSMLTNRAGIDEIDSAEVIKEAITYGYILECGKNVFTR